MKQSFTVDRYFPFFILDMLSQNDRKKEIKWNDIEIRKHNLKRIKNQYFNKNLILIEGSSIEQKVKKKVYKIAKNKKTIMVILDSNHSSKHVYEELSFYSKFVTKNSYCIVFDTIVEDLPNKFVKNRPWSKGNNPLTAVKLFLKGNKVLKLTMKLIIN